MLTANVRNQNDKTSNPKLIDADRWCECSQQSHSFVANAAWFYEGVRNDQICQHSDCIDDEGFVREGVFISRKKENVFDQTCHAVEKPTHGAPELHLYSQGVAGCEAHLRQPKVMVTEEKDTDEESWQSFQDNNFQGFGDSSRGDRIEISDDCLNTVNGGSESKNFPSHGSCAH